MLFGCGYLFPKRQEQEPCCGSCGSGEKCNENTLKNNSGNESKVPINIHLNLNNGYYHNDNVANTNTENLDYNSDNSRRDIATGGRQPRYEQRERERVYVVLPTGERACVPEQVTNPSNGDKIRITETKKFIEYPEYPDFP